MKNQINNVNVEKASANVKANSLIALDVLKSVKEKIKDFLKQLQGQKQKFIKKNFLRVQTKSKSNRYAKSSEM